MSTQMCRSTRLLVFFSTLISMRAATRPVRAFTVADGLAHDHVSRIYRDSQDFLWICTDEGLSRFDGRTFVNYTVSDGLPHIHINDIVEADGGDYWIATDGGLTLFRTNDPAHRFSTYRPEGPAGAQFINVLIKDQDAGLLIGTGAGLYRMRRRADSVLFDPVDFGFPHQMPEGGSVSTLFLDHNGTLWVGAVSGLYGKARAGKWIRYTVADGLPAYYVNHLAADPAGRLWVCTRQGLARLVAKPNPGQPVVDLKFTDKNGLPHEDIRTMLCAADGRCWLGTLGGLVEWTPGAAPSKQFRTHSVQEGFADREIYALAIGPDGNLWIGSRRGGLMRLSRSGFETYGLSDGVHVSGSDEIVETMSGSVCVATITDPRRAIHCFDGHRFRTTIPRLSGKVSQIGLTSSQSTMVDHKGEWWISNIWGLLRYRPERINARAPIGPPEARLLPDRQSRTLFEDSRGDVWITTWKQGIFGLARWMRAPAAIEDLTEKMPALLQARGATSLAEVPDGQLWLGLGRPGGLFRRRNNRFEQISSSLPGTIQALYRDHANRLWIASAEAGLGRIANPADDRVDIRVYNRSHGLSSNEVWCITEDRNGRIYAGTARGVDRIDPSTERITHFSSADGLAAGDVRAALRARTGDLWFLSNRGLSRFRPDDRTSESKSKVRITGIRVAGMLHPISELGQAYVAPAEFGWNRNSVQIDFSAIAFQSSDPVKYEFLLEGAGAGWGEPSLTSTIHFSNLGPGRYRFLVRTDQHREQAPAEFAFTITSPPWQRWWFQGGIAALLLAAAYFILSLRMERRIALERVRSGIATDLHDDIGASLSRIAVMSEALKSRVSPEDDDSKRMLADMAESSRSLVNGMSDIVWSIDPRRDHVGDVVARLRAFGSDVLEPCGIHWTCEGPSDILDRTLSPNQRRELYLIFKEAIHNIERHAGASNVVLKITCDGNRVSADIQDDGRGVSSGNGSGLGLSSMQARAQRLRGEILISSRSEGGTRASLTFPLKTRNA